MVLEMDDAKRIADGHHLVLTRAQQHSAYLRLVTQQRVPLLDTRHVETLVIQDVEEFVRAGHEEEDVLDKQPRLDTLLDLLGQLEGLLVGTVL